ncbi:DinB family protein [Streptomyces sp. NPDC001922]|uniref:DinB family protein n=1 Tax=Streptomyces sp. NPDC001922 TaxID=3364624 RepID=UPI003684E49B
MTRMTTAERTMPPTVADERTMLESWLEFHRETLAAKCAGLDEKQLREASAPPSILSLMGLVRHMADVERHWFRNILAGEAGAAQPLFWTDEDQDRDLRLTPDDSWEEAQEIWQREMGRAREAAAGRGLDDIGAGEHHSGKTFSLRWIYVHMIEEYARHNGHADLIRERIDGSTGM